jgi:hypothetical protein
VGARGIPPGGWKIVRGAKLGWPEDGGARCAVVAHAAVGREAMPVLSNVRIERDVRPMLVVGAVASIAALTSQQLGDQGGGAACAVGLDGLVVLLAADLLCDRVRDDVGW